MVEIRLDYAEIDGDRGVIRLDCLDVVQAMHAAGVFGSAGEMDCEMADDIRALKDQLASGQDKCETCRFNPPLYKCGEADFCCMTCAHRRSCLCVECGKDGVNHWAWKGRDDGQNNS
jgi:hypothetical protein